MADRSLAAGTFLLVCTIVAALYVTQFPFDFCDWGLGPWSNFRQRFDFGLSDISDWKRNVTMFVPFGFGLASHWRHRSTGGVLVVAMATSAAFSLFLEFLQTQGSARAGTLGDLISNTLGGSLGCLLFGLLRPGFVRASQAFFRALAPLLRPRLLESAALLWVLAFLGVAVHLAGGGLDTWDQRFPVQLGNEATGDRPWSGTVSGLTIRAAGETVAEYDLTGAGPFSERAGRAPALHWQGTPGGSSEGARLSGQGWLVSKEPMAGISRRLHRAKELVVDTTVRTHRLDQDGPARILSISPDPYRTNLTVGQSGDRLSIRLRTAATTRNGRRPEISVPGVFLDDAPHRLEIAYRDQVLTVAVDGERRTAFTIEPAITFFRYLLPSGAWAVCSSRTTVWFYELVFYALVFVPFGLLFGGRTWWLGLAVPLLWEALLVAIGGLPWHGSHIVFGLAAAAAGIIAGRH